MPSIVYREIQCLGTQLVPQRGPLVLLTATVNFTLFHQIPRKASAIYSVTTKEMAGERRFVARRLLNSFLPLPISTASDDEGFTERLRHLLEHGDCVWIHTTDPEALDFLAEIFLKIEAANQGQLGITCLIAETKSSRVVTLRRDVRMRLRPLMVWQNAVKRFAESAHEAVQSLTVGLKENFLFATSSGTWRRAYEQVNLQDELFIERLSRLQALEFDEEKDVAARDSERLLAYIRPLLQAEQLPKDDIALVRQRVRTFWHLLTSLRVKDRSLYIHEDLNAVRRSTFKKLLLYMPLIPLGIWGIVNHYVIYKFPDWVAFWSNQQIPQPNRWRLMIAPFIYLLQYALIDALCNSAISLLYLLTLPIFGYFGLLLIENRSRIWDHVRLLHFLRRQHALKNDLLNMRWEILDTLAGLTGANYGSRDDEKQFKVS